MLNSLYPIICFYNGEGGGDSGDAEGGYDGEVDSDEAVDAAADTMGDLSDVQLGDLVNPVLLESEFTEEGAITFPLTGTVGSNVGIDNLISSIKFKAKPGYYYSKVPTPVLNFPGGNNYTVLPTIGAKDTDGRVIEITYKVYYNGAENVFDFDQHNIQFLHETKKLPEAPIYKEIFKIDVDQADLPAKGKTLPIRIAGTPQATFSIDIRDKNNKSIITPKAIITKVSINAKVRSNRIDINNNPIIEDNVIDTLEFIDDLGVTKESPKEEKKATAKEEKKKTTRGSRRKKVEDPTT